jgi:hypothetical protein
MTRRRHGVTELTTGIGAAMSTKRALLITLGIILLATLVVGCSSTAEDATFIGYKQRPASSGSPGIAIVQLSSGVPVEAKCKYSSLENGTPVQVVKNGDAYEVVSSSPDWTQ